MTIDHHEATNEVLLSPPERELHAEILLGFCSALKTLGFIRNFWTSHKFRRMPNGGHGTPHYVGTKILVDARRQPDGY